MEQAATLKDGNEVAAHTSKCESSESDDDEANQQNLTDEQLFEICGGRTAHKGARHNVKQNGKLARIAQQEHELEINRQM